MDIAHSRRYRFDRELEYSSSANKISSLSAESLTEMIVRVTSKNCTVTMDTRELASFHCGTI